MSSSRFLVPVKQALRVLPDRAYIQLYYLAKFGRFCNLRSPSTYNEKLQWLKLHYRVAADAVLVDKLAAKRVVGDKIGSEHIIPTLRVYDSAEDIDFTELPEAFVLKCTHDSEGVVIVDGTQTFDPEAIRAKLRRALSRNFYPIGREPHYRNLRPRVIAEPYLEDDTSRQLFDYKFFCFDSEVKALFIASDRTSGEVKFDYFDAEFTPLDLRQNYPRSAVPPSKPRRFEEMKQIAGVLAQGHPHVRVDLYEVNGRVYFGELTFFHFSGFAPFKPPEWDRIWGEWLKLPIATDTRKPGRLPRVHGEG